MPVITISDGARLHRTDDGDGRPVVVAGAGVRPDAAIVEFLR